VIVFEPLGRAACSRIGQYFAFIPGLCGYGSNARRKARRFFRVGKQIPRGSLASRPETWHRRRWVFRKWHIVRLAKISENAKLRLMASCIVSFADLDGVRHSVEVQTEGLYEAAVLGLCTFLKHDLEPQTLTELEVEVRSSITLSVTVKKVRDWLQRGVRTPKEAVLKERLRALI